MKVFGMEVVMERFEELKAQAESDYKKIGSVFCPYFKMKVAFNSKGLEHIKFKTRKKARLVSEQFMRLKLLKLAKVVLERSNTLQEFMEKRQFEHLNINSRWEQRAVLVSYYGFIAIINEVRVKVIVKQVEEGDPFFWSIVPFWKTKDPLVGQIKKIFHEGDLESQ